MINILVTGINGFVGIHLARELHSRGCKVTGVGRNNTANPSLASLLDNYFVCDLTNSNEVAGIPLKDITAIVNLAGLSNLGASFGQKELYRKVNVGVLNVIGERIMELGLKTRVIAVSTGAVYSSNQPMPLTEKAKLIEKGSPYALSKLAMEAESARLRKLGLGCYVARPFNHIGPGQKVGFLVPDLYQKIIDAIARNGTVLVGDLTTKRDYTDVRDVAKAYADLALSEHLDKHIYNICSGRSIPGSKIFDILAANIPGAKGIETKRNEAFIRPSDPKDLYGDNSSLVDQTGWKPEITLEQTIKDFVTASLS